MSLFRRLSSHKIPLHWVLVVPFVIQVVGAVGLVGWLSYRSGQQAVEGLANKLTSEVAERVSDRLDTFLQSQQQSVRLSLQAVEQGSLSVNRPDQMQSYFWQQMLLSPKLASVGFSSIREFELGYVRLQSQALADQASKIAGEHLPVNTLLFHKIPSSVGKRVYYLVDQQGQPKKSIYTFNIDVKSTPHFRYGKAAKKQTWSPVYVYRVVPMLAIAAIAPVYDRFNHFQGVLTSNVSLSEISSFLSTLSFSPKGQSFIVDRHGNLVATSTLETLFTKPAKGESKQIKALNSQDIHTREVTQALLKQYGDLRNLKLITHLKLKVNQHTHYVQATSYRDDYGLDWLIVTVLPESDFMDEINRNVWLTILLSTLTLLGATATGILTAYFIARPIQRLSRASQALAEGQWQQSLKEDSKIGELSVLATSFNITAEKLQQSLDRIKTALENSEEKFTKVFRNCPDPIAITTADEWGRYLEVNESFLKFSEFSREDLLGRNALELAISAVPEQNAKLLEILQTQGRVQAFEYHYRTKTGKSGTTLLSVELIELDGQQRVLTIAKDITERKHFEESLRESEARFQKVTSAAPGEIYILLQHPDGSFEFEYMSPACREIQELEPEQVMQYPDLSFEQVHPADRETMYVLAAQSAQTLEPFVHEWRIITPSGKVKWVQVSARPERRNNGATAWYGVLQDVSDRKRAEEALRESKERFQQLATASPGVLYTVVEYPSGPVKYEYLSNAFEEIHEIAVAEALENPSITFKQIHPADLNAYQQAVASSVATMQMFKHEWRIITPSGKTKWVQANSRPERRANGEIAWHGVVLDITEQKQIERALKQALQQIDAHFDNSPLGILQWDKNFNILRWSKQAERLFGWTMEEVSTNSWKELRFVHEDDHDRVNHEIADLLSGVVTSKAVQNRNYTKDGRVILCQWYSSAVFDEGGNLLSVLSFAQDITDREQAQMELRHQKDLRETIFNESTDALFLVDPDTLLIVDCNRRAEELFEDTKANLIGIEGRTLQHQPFTEKEINQITLAMASKGFWSGEIEYITRKGKLFWGNLAAKPVNIANQSFNLVRVTDISDRKRSEAERKKAGETLKRQLSIIESTIDGIAILENGIYTYLNKAHIEMVGYEKADDLIGKSWKVIYPDNEIQRFEQDIFPILQQKKQWQGEATAIRKDGSTFFEELSFTLTESGSLICVCRDVSDRYKLDRMKNEFISVVSHELRTPLTAIRGSLGILETDVFNDRPEKAKQMLQVALNNSDRLVRLVNDILDLERLESGKVALVKEWCEVADLMQEAVDSVQAIATQEDLTLNVSLLQTKIWADPDAIVQAFTNLLSNAIKFSPAGSTIWFRVEQIGAEIAAVSDIKTIKESSDSSLSPLSSLSSPSSPSPLSSPSPFSLLFSIKDQGRGIPTDKLETIFGRFQQVDVSDSRQKGGTGLGLAICKSIIQQHDGQIWAESTLSQGSTFYIRLPLKG